MYVRVRYHNGQQLIHVKSVDYSECEKEFPEYDKMIVFHLEHDLYILIPGEVIKKTGPGRHLADSLFKSSELPSLIDFTTSFWQGLDKYEMYNAYGDDMRLPPEDSPAISKQKAREKFNVIK